MMTARADDGRAAADIEASIDAAIAACDGNPRAAIRALILVNAYLEAELDRLCELVSPGFARGKVRDA